MHFLYAMLRKQHCLSGAGIGVFLSSSIALCSTQAVERTDRYRRASLSELSSRVYTAPNTAFSVEIIPNNPLGSGPGVYRFLTEGRERLSTTFPFTLWNAALTKQGVLIGYSYSDGLSAKGPASPGMAGSELLVSIIDSDGKLIGQDKLLRAPIGVSHTFPAPVGTSIIALDQYDLCLVGIWNASELGRADAWRYYSMSTGHLAFNASPEAPFVSESRFPRVFDICAVPSVPFLLVGWKASIEFGASTSKSAGGERRALCDVFSINSFDGKIVDKFVLGQLSPDVEIAGTDKARRIEGCRAAYIVSARDDQRFILQCIAEDGELGRQISCSIRKGPDLRWSVVCD